MRVTTDLLEASSRTDPGTSMQIRSHKFSCARRLRGLIKGIGLLSSAVNTNRQQSPSTSTVAAAKRQSADYILQKPVARKVKNVERLQPPPQRPPLQQPQQQQQQPSAPVDRPLQRPAARDTSTEADWQLGDNVAIRRLQRQPAQRASMQQQQSTWINDASRQDQEVKPNQEIERRRPYINAKEVNISKQILRDIRDEWHTADEALATGNPLNILPTYFSRMDEIWAASRTHRDLRHVTEVIQGTVTVWKTANIRHKGWQTPRFDQALRTFLGDKLVALREQSQELRHARVSSTFLSFVRLKINPDSLLPGIVDVLGKSFIADLRHATGQSMSLVLFCSSKLRLNPCNGRVVDAVLEDLTTKDLSDFDAPAITSILYSITKFPKAQPTYKMVKVMSARLLEVLLFHPPDPYFRAPEISNCLFALNAFASTKPPIAKPSTALLDAMCEAFYDRLHIVGGREQPRIQEITSLAWSCSKLRYLPSPKLTQGLLTTMHALCQDPREVQPPGSISAFLVACADFRMILSQADADIMVDRILTDRDHGYSPQDLANTTWSLGVLGLLQFDNFRQMLQRLQAAASSTTPFNKLDIDQMYSALHGLKPSADATEEAHQTYLQLQSEMEQMAPQSDVGAMHAAVTAERGELPSFMVLKGAFSRLGFRDTDGDAFGLYWVDVVVRSPYDSVRPILITMSPQSHYFENANDRLLGRQAFRNKVLAQDGIPVDLLWSNLSESMDQTALYLRSVLESATGDNLDAYYA